MMMMMMTELDQRAVDLLRGYVGNVWQAAKRVTARVNEALTEEVWKQQAAAVQYALLSCSSQSERQGAEGTGRKQARMCCKHSTVASAAADDGEVVGEGEAQAAAAGGCSSCGVMEQHQQQQPMAALCALVMHSKRRTDLQHMVRVSLQQL
jgi:hypothetical protein